MVFERVPLYVLAESCVDMLQLKAGKANVTLELKGTSHAIWPEIGRWWKRYFIIYVIMPFVIIIRVEV